MRAGAALWLATCALAALPPDRARAEDDAVIVIRGSQVSVARPLTPERVREGGAEVEIVRVEPPPPPPPRALPEPEREIIFVPIPVEPALVPVGIPIAWDARWFWRRDSRDPFARRFHTSRTERSGMRRNLHGR